MTKVRTIQLGNKLVIVDGFSPLRYLDLTTNKVHKYNFKEHSHDWLITKENIPFRDEDGGKFIIDFYVCECGAGGKIVTPKSLYDKGLKQTEIAHV